MKIKLNVTLEGTLSTEDFREIANKWVDYTTDKFRNETKPADIDLEITIK